jgi:apolipoprotein N-acyltransferase
VACGPASSRSPSPPGVVGQVERRLWTRIGYRWWIAAAPLAFGLQAIVRLHLPFAGSNGFLALDLFRHPAVLQPVGVVGIVGLEIGIVLVNVVLAAVGDEPARRRPLPPVPGPAGWLSVPPTFATDLGRIGARDRRPTSTSPT